MTIRILLTVFTCLVCNAQADVNKIGNVNKPHLRIRVGDNAHAGVDKVIFNVPGLALGNSASVVSTNNISGGTAGYTVRVVMDNRRNPSGTAHINADSSTPLKCVTPASCNITTIPFNKISWSRRDGDNLDLANQFDGTANQLLHEQTVGAVNNPNPPRLGWRYRDYIQFAYANDLFLPAGTYRGRVTFSGSTP